MPGACPQGIPLFYSMLTSGSQQHAQERTWLLRLLAAGLRVSTSCTPIVQRRYSRTEGCRADRAWLW